MSGVVKSDLHFRIGHVLFIDIVGYSNLLITEQHDHVEQLNRLVRASHCFRTAESTGELLCLPTGDGMALVFSGTVEAAAECALEVAKEIKKNPPLQVRMGIHSGPISLITDVNDRSNVAGAGINLAQRVMSRGDAGHILLSRHVAEDLEQYPRWRSCLHDLGECEIKHGHKLGIVNCYTEQVGNSEIPLKMRHAEPERAALRFGRREKVLALVACGLIVAAAALLLFRQVEPPRLAKSIAVLPFESLSDDKQNAYFASGIQDDVLTNLAKIGDLKVISRTSVMQYQGHPPSVREIGKALGVGAVLEGSVRRDGSRVRVNVQLIDAETDEHIWAEDYDRELTDVFAIQSDLALRIASALQSKLSPTEEARLQRPPTSNGEAYLTYLQARDHVVHGRLEEAIQLYQKAIQLDPTFALAFANLSYVENSLYQASGDPVLLERAGAAAKEALRLQPNLPEAHLALAYDCYRGRRDYMSALRELEIAQAGLPNDSDVFLVIGSIKRRQGKWTESIVHLEKAASLDPNEPSVWANLGTSYLAVHDFIRAARSFDRGITADPEFFFNHWLRAQLEIDRKGDLAFGEQVIERIAAMPDPDGQIALARFQLKLMQRKYGEALDVLSRSDLPWLSAWRPPTPIPRFLLLGQVNRLLGDQNRAQTSFEAARQIMERAVAENPTDASRHALFGEAYAGLGRKEEALREGKRAVELLPESKDALDGPDMTLALARIHCMLGETEPALALLEHLFAIPGGISAYRLKLDPTWDPLRANPRFEKMLASVITGKET
jgi:TolB-like protein/Tfp pilus assembly protein PilF